MHSAVQPESQVKSSFLETLSVVISTGKAGDALTHTLRLAILSGTFLLVSWHLQLQSQSTLAFFTFTDFMAMVELSWSDSSSMAEYSPDSEYSSK